MSAASRARKRRAVEQWNRAIDEMLAVTCPTCGAEPGEFCDPTNQHDDVDIAHDARKALAAAAPPPAVGKPFTPETRRALDTARWSGL